MAIRLGLDYEFYADQAARPAAVVHYELSPERLRQFLRNLACKDIGAATGRERDNDAHRSCGIRLGANGYRCKQRHEKCNGMRAMPVCRCRSHISASLSLPVPIR
jgi:hypothetical protein